MERRIRLLAILTLAVMLFTTLPFAAMAETEKVEINYYTWHDEDAYMIDIVNAFNAQSTTTHVNYVSYPSTNDEYYDKMLVLLASNSDVDVIGVNGAPWYSKYYNQGILLGLNDLIKENNYDISPFGTLFTQYAIDGEYYALPHRRTTYCLYYNKDLFDAQGIPYPENLTWEQYADLAKQMTIGDGPDKQYGTFMTLAQYSWMVPACQMGETLLDDEIPGIRYCLELYDRLFNVDKSSMNFAEYLSYGSQAVRALFEQGKIAMYPGGDWTTGMLLDDQEAGKVSINWDIASLPVPEGYEANVSVGQGTFTGITTLCENPQNAFEFLSYACGLEGAKVVASSGTLPGYNSEETKELYLAAAKVPGAQYLFECNVNMELPPHVLIGEVRDVCQEEIHPFYVGEMTLDECMEKIYERRAKVLNK